MDQVPIQILFYWIYSVILTLIKIFINQDGKARSRIRVQTEKVNNQCRIGSGTLLIIGLAYKLIKSILQNAKWSVKKDILTSAICYCNKLQILKAWYFLSSTDFHFKLARNFSMLLIHLKLRVFIFFITLGAWNNNFVIHF